MTGSPDGRARAVSIRPATVADLDQMVEIQLEAALRGFAHIFPETAPKPSHETLRPGLGEILEDPSVSVAVAVADAVVGFVVVRPDPDVPAGWLLQRLYVHPDHWRCRIGSRLHDHALEIARRRGAGALDLWVLEANAVARGMYERRGWRLVAGMRRANRSVDVADVLYRRLLTDR